MVKVLEDSALHGWSYDQIKEKMRNQFLLALNKDKQRTEKALIAGPKPQPY